eukprot:jgi/Orpsp1_1/1182866/evm.model.c7180000082986.1
MNGISEKAVTPSLINSFIEDSKNDFLEMILNHFVLDNGFILNLLKSYNTKEALSNKQFFAMVTQKKNRIIISDDMYEKAISSGNIDALRILFINNYSSRYSIIYKIIKFNLLEKAININNYEFVKILLNLKPLSYKNYECKDLLFKANEKENKNNDKNCKDGNSIMLLLTESLLSSVPKVSNEKSFEVKYDAKYFNCILNRIIELKNLNLIKYLFENDQYKSSIDLNACDTNGEYPLFFAFDKNCFEIFKYLLAQGADGNIKNKNGSSLLISIILQNKKEYLEHLLNYKLNITEKDISGNDPLILAIKNNAFDIAILLIEYSQYHAIDMNHLYNDSGNTPLILAYRQNYMEIFKYLVEYLDINKRDSQGNNILYYALEREDEETIKYLMNQSIDIYSYNNYGKSCLDYAIAKGYKIFNVVLMNSVHLEVNKPNKKNEIPLLTIIKSNNYTSKNKIELVKYLIQKGSNVNYVDDHKNTPLIYAIQKELNQIVYTLIKNGANVNYYNEEDNKTVLTYAIETKKKIIIKLIVENSGNVNYKYTDNNITALERALRDKCKLDPYIIEYIIKKMEVEAISNNVIKYIIKNENLKALKNLVENQLDINFKDSKGNTLLAYAIQKKKKEILEYLITLKGIDYHSKNNNDKSIDDL